MSSKRFCVLVSGDISWNMWDIDSIWRWHESDITAKWLWITEKKRKTLVNYTCQIQGWENKVLKLLSQLWSSMEVYEDGIDEGPHRVFEWDKMGHFMTVRRLLDSEECWQCQGNVMVNTVNCLCCVNHMSLMTLWQAVMGKTCDKSVMIRIKTAMQSTEYYIWRLCKHFFNHGSHNVQYLNGFAMVWKQNVIQKILNTWTMSCNKTPCLSKPEYFYIF